MTRFLDWIALVALVVWYGAIAYYAAERRNAYTDPGESANRIAELEQQQER